MERIEDFENTLRLESTTTAAMLSLVLLLGGCRLYRSLDQYGAPPDATSSTDIRAVDATADTAAVDTTPDSETSPPDADAVSADAPDGSDSDTAPDGIPPCEDGATYCSGSCSNNVTSGQSGTGASRCRRVGIFGGDDIDAATDLAVGPNGSLYIVGYTRSNLGAAPKPKESNAFVARVDLSGNEVVTVKTLGSDNEDRAESVAIGANGRVYVGGVFDVDTSQTDGFVAQYEPDLGKQNWRKSVGLELKTGQSPAVRAIAFNETLDTLFVAGEYRSMMGDDQIFVARYAPDGSSIQPAHLFGSGGAEQAGDAVADGDGIFLVGTTDGGMPGSNFQGKNSVGKSDVFYTKIAQGSRTQEVFRKGIWQFGSHEIDEGLSIATDSNGGVVIGGYSEGENWSWNQTIASRTQHGNGDVFVARYANGNPDWLKQMGRSGSERVNGLAYDDRGSAGSSLFATGPCCNGSGMSQPRESFLLGFTPKPPPTNTDYQSALRLVGTGKSVRSTAIAATENSLLVAGSTRDDFGLSKRFGDTDVFWVELGRN